MCHHLLFRLLRSNELKHQLLSVVQTSAIDVESLFDVLAKDAKFLLGPSSLVDKRKLPSDIAIGLRTQTLDGVHHMNEDEFIGQLQSTLELTKSLRNSVRSTSSRQGEGPKTKWCVKNCKIIVN